MAITHLGVIAAFGAGVVSFLSPCVFPLVPGYLSYIAGTTAREAQREGAARWRVTAHAIFFVLGFAGARGRRHAHPLRSVPGPARAPVSLGRAEVQYAVV